MRRTLKTGSEPHKHTIHGSRHFFAPLRDKLNIDTNNKSVIPEKKKYSQEAWYEKNVGIAAAFDGALY